MQTKRKIRKINTTFYLPIPPDLVKFLKLKDYSMIILEDNNSNIVKFWKEDDDVNNTKTIE